MWKPCAALPPASAGERRKKTVASLAALPPALYHAHHGTFAADLPFWEALAARAGGPVLALGCGTGRVALPLAAAGFPTVGVDWDAAMLAFLQRRVAARGGSLPLGLVQTDFRALPFGAAAFPLAVLPCNTYTTMPPRERAAFLQGVARVLRPGGFFAFSAPNPALVAALPLQAEAEPEAAFRHPESGLPVQVSSGWRREGTRWTVRWHYDTLHPDGTAKRVTVSQIHWLAPVEAERGLLEAAGLHLVAEYGGFDHAPPAPDAPYWVVVAQRL